MSTEHYLNHPTFGLLFRICAVEPEQELFSTLYSHRLFFLVSQRSGPLNFEPINRIDAKTLVEQRLRLLRREGVSQELQQLQAIQKSTFW
jgi:PII interaction protein X